VKFHSVLQIQFNSSLVV